MLINFRPTNFDYAKYEALSNLDKMRFDANLIYYRLYMWYATRFIGTKFFNRILAPKLDSLTPKNRQICLADMEHVVRGLYSLMAVYTEFLLPQTRAPLNEKFAAIDALAELSDILYAEVGMFLYADHQDKFQVHKPSLDSRAYYFPNEPEDIEFDLQAGFAYFYDFILGAREHTPTPIMISYRNDGAGKGAVFDHAVFQHIAHRDTVILTDGKLPPLINTALMHEDLPALSYGVDTDKDPYKRPLQLDELGLFAQEEGLVVIPGLAEVPADHPKYASITNQNNIRAAFENPFVAKALGKRTLLFICGGLYRLFEVLGQTLHPVKDHSGSMPHFSKKQMVDYAVKHAVTIQPGSKIAALLGFDAKNSTLTLGTTSIHHKAALVDNLNNNFHDKFNVSAKVGNVVEAVESKGVGPTAIGTQFHPESALGNTADEKRQQNLINQLALQADAARIKNVNAIREEISTPCGVFRSLGGLTIENNFDAIIKQRDAHNTSAPSSMLAPDWMRFVDDDADEVVDHNANKIDQWQDEKRESTIPTFDGI